MENGVYSMSFAYLLSTLLTGQNLAVLGAFLAATLGGIGSAKGVGMVAQAADGLLSEDPGIFGKVLLLVALPGTQGIYGLITEFLIMVKIGLIGSPVELTVAQGMYLLIASLPIAIVGLISAIHQAKVGVAGVQMLSKQRSEVGKAITNAALVETYAILALLISLLLIIFFKV